MPSKPSLHTLILLALLAVCSFLTFYHLDQPAFWDDEAATCTFARNIVNDYGYTGWDGRNFYGYHNGEALDQNFRFRDPPLGTYIVALSFKFFGISDFTGRLPFALCGILGLVALWYLLRCEFEEAPALALYGVAALGLSVTYLLSARTARYYSVSALSTILMMLYYRRFLTSKRYFDALCFAVAAIAAFYSTYLLCVAFLVALAIRHLLFHRKEFTREHLRPLAAALCLFFLGTAPYAWHYRVWARSDFDDPTPWPLKHLELTWWNFRDINYLEILPWTTGIALAAVLLYQWHRDTNRKLVTTAVEWVVLTGASVLALSILSPQQTNILAYAFTRYQCFVYPLLAGLLGVLLWFVHQRSKGAAIALLGIVVSCNALTLSPWQRAISSPRHFEWLLPAYVEQITNPYPTANQEVADYLRANANQDDLVMSLPDFMEYPMLWYIGDKVKICCQLDDTAPLPLDRVRALGAPIFLDNTYPDWVVFYGRDSQDGALLKHYSQPYAINGVMGSRKYKLAQLLNVYSEQTQRPELFTHLFSPKTDFGLNHSVAIFHADPWRVTD